MTRDHAFQVSLKRDCQRKCTGKRENLSDVTREWPKIWSGIQEKAASLKVFVKYFPAHETGKLKNIAGISGKGPPIETPLKGEVL